MTQLQTLETKIERQHVRYEHAVDSGDMTRAQQLLEEIKDIEARLESLQNFRAVGMYA